MFAPLLMLGFLAAAYAELEAPDVASSPPVRLAFAGDLSLSLRVGHLIETRARGGPVPAEVDAAYPFGFVRDRIAAADLAVGNLECVTSPRGVAGNVRSPLRAPVEAIALVRDAGFDVVSVANNHAFDYGAEGLDDMLARLDAENLAHAGRPTSVGPEHLFVRQIRGVRIGLLAYHDVVPEKAYGEVALARASVDVLVVFNHWGLQGAVHPLGVQQSFGHGLVDAGADLVVGTHAHVVQPEEWYRGKLIFYGLGNFVFAGMGFDELHRTGGFLEVDVDRRGVVARRFYRARIDDLGAPRWLDVAPSQPASLDDMRPRAPTAPVALASIPVPVPVTPPAR